MITTLVKLLFYQVTVTLTLSLHH